MIDTIFDPFADFSPLLTSATEDMTREELSDYYDQRRRELQRANTQLVEEKRELKRSLLQALKDLMEKVQAL